VNGVLDGRPPWLLRHPGPQTVVLKDKLDEFLCQPAAIADTVFHLIQQDRSAWSFEVDLRPFGEKW